MKKLQSQLTTLLTLTLLVTTSACASNSSTGGGSSSDSYSLPVTIDQAKKTDASEVSVMTFNVENLFDNTHDKDREDFPYLPRSQKNTPEVKAFCAKQSGFRRTECEELDWNDQVVQTKLENVSQVIRVVDGGKGPDNLMLVEVENERIVKRLVSEKLNDLGYKTVVVLEGPDLRGIDPGFISKFPLAEPPKKHIIPFKLDDPEQLRWAQRSRGILEVTVQMPNKKTLTFFIGHFPSQNNPTEWRTQAVQFAKGLVAENTKRGRASILGGDLNITPEEDESHGFFKKEFSDVGQVSHLVGCKDCHGTHNHKGSWSFLDALIFSHNLKSSGYELLTDSFVVLRTPVNMRPNGTPMRFDAEKVKGVADHFPLYSRIKTSK